MADNRTSITELMSVEAPELLELHGIGTVTEAIVLTVLSHPGRIRSEATEPEAGAQ